jgi:hypothetical protein
LQQTCKQRRDLQQYRPPPPQVICNPVCYTAAYHAGCNIQKISIFNISPNFDFWENRFDFNKNQKHIYIFLKFLSKTYLRRGTAMFQRNKTVSSSNPKAVFRAGCGGARRGFQGINHKISKNHKKRRARRPGSIRGRVIL